MSNLKDKFQKLKNSYWQIAGVLFLILLAAFLLWFNNFSSMQAQPALIAQVKFEGEYHWYECKCGAASEKEKHFVGSAV